MPENKDTDRSLSYVQLDDFDVNRQRERLERSRPGNMQSDKPQDSSPSADQPRQQPREQQRR